MRKTLVLMLDGFGDVANFDIYNGKSCFEYLMQSNKLPNFSYFFSHGSRGLMDPVAPGLACGSDTAHLSLLGYDPRIHYKGRGAFECLGSGISLEMDEIAFKCNFALSNPDSSFSLQRKPPNLSSGEAAELALYFNDKEFTERHPKFSFKVIHQKEHRIIVKLKGPNLCAKITGTDPLKDNLPLLVCKPLDVNFNIKHEFHNAVLTSQLINDLSCCLREQILTYYRDLNSAVKTNVVLFRGGAMRQEFVPFNTLHSLRSFMISETCIISGIGLSLGMELIKESLNSEDKTTKKHNKIQTALNLLTREDSFSFGFVHFKEIDEACHNGNFTERFEAILSIENALTPLVSYFKSGMDAISLIITGDHTSLCSTKDHSVEAVPFVIFPALKDCVLGRFPGGEFMKICKYSMNVNQ